MYPRELLIRKAAIPVEYRHAVTIHSPVRRTSRHLSSNSSGYRMISRSVVGMRGPFQSSRCNVTDLFLVATIDD